MNSYKINTKLFGELEIPKDEGIYEFFEIGLGSKLMRVALNVFDGFLSDENIVVVQKFIEEIPSMYEKGRQKLLEIKDSDATVKYFMEFHLDELEEDMLALFKVESVDEITSELFIQTLGLRTVSIAPDAKKGIDCTLDFSFPEDMSDELLVVRFDQAGDLCDISHES